MFKWRTFAVGDRVTRPRDVYEDGSPLLHGTVVNVRRNVVTKWGVYDVLYDVQWDGVTVVSRSFLPHGISLEASPADEKEK